MGAIGKLVAPVLFVAGLTAATGVSAVRQDSPSEALLARSRQALGGATLAAVKTLAISATMSLSFGGTIPVTTRTAEINYIAPDKYLSVGRQLSNWPNGVEFAYYDGFSGRTPIRDIVASMPAFSVIFDGPRPTEDAATYRARRLNEEIDACIQMMLPLFMAPGNFGLTSEVDAGAGRLVIWRLGGRRWMLTLDAKSGLPTQLSWKAPRPAAKTMSSGVTQTATDGAVPTNPTPIVYPVDPRADAPDVDWIMTIRDYKLGDGLNWPRRFVTTVAGKTFLDVRIVKYLINPQIDPAVFQRRFR